VLAQPVCAGIGGALIAIIAIHKRVGASRNLVTAIRSTSITIIAVNGRVHTTSGGVAEVTGGAVITVITIFRDIYATAGGGFTCIAKGTGIPVIAVDGSIYTISGQVAEVTGGAVVAIIAIFRDIYATAGGGFTCIAKGTGIPVIAVDGSIYTISGQVAEVTGGAVVAIIAIFRDIYATAGGGFTCIAKGTGIPVIAVDGSIYTISGQVAEVTGGAVIGIITIFWGMSASNDIITAIRGTGISIIAAGSYVCTTR